MMSFDEIMGRQDVPVVAGDEQGNITWVNDAFVEAFGWPQEEVVGGSIVSIMPAYMHDAHTLGFSRFLTMSAGRVLDQPLDLPVRHRSGRESRATHLIVAERCSGQWRFAATIVPSDWPAGGGSDATDR